MHSLVADPAQVAALAAAQRADTEAFGHYLDLLWERDGHDDAALDSLVSRIAEEVAAAVDCTQCGNCCRMPIGLEPGDVPGLAAALGVTPQVAIERLVDHEGGQPLGEWAVMRGVPCPLLRDSPGDARCTIYPHRPAACRAYPALVPDFRWLYDVLAADAGLCPIVYNVIERLKLAMGWRSG